MDKISQLVEDIKSLKIQGATNVALTTIQGLSIALSNLKVGNHQDSEKYLKESLSRLAFARPTEPLAQNSINFIFQKKQDKPEAYLKQAEDYKNLITESKNKMADYGGKLILDGGIYLTHCHSSTVTNMLISAHKQGKKFKVYVTETRPLYQGRLTVTELLNAGLSDVIMIIDDVADSLLLENKLQFSGVFIGADLLSADGFINKVGSKTIAFCANQNNIPLYCLSILLKYSPLLVSEKLLEVRKSYEIWPEAPQKLKFYTPAFDFIPFYSNISVVSEAGIFKGNETKSKALSLYPFLNFTI